jgi:hypothetical protein
MTAVPSVDKADLLRRFHAMAARGEPIVGGGAGTGLSAKCEEAGGIDLIVIYNSGRFRMSGRGSLAGMMPYGDANAIVMEMAAEVLPVVRDTPVLAGVCGTDPFRRMDVFLDEVIRVGFAGVQNFRPSGSSTASSAKTSKNRHGLRARGRDDRCGEPQGSFDHALRVLGSGCARDGGGRCGYRRLSSRPDDGRQHRGGNGAEARGLPRAGRPVGGGGPGR